MTETPAGGYTMYGATYFLSASTEQDSVAELRELEHAGATGMAGTTLSYLWEKLVEHGDVTVQAVKPSADAAAVLDRSLLIGARPDFTLSTIEIAGIVYHQVRVFPDGAPSHTARSPKEQSSSTGKNKAGRAPEHGDDFIQEMLYFAIVEGCPTRHELGSVPIASVTAALIHLTSEVFHGKAVLVE